MPGHLAEWRNDKDRRFAWAIRAFDSRPVSLEFQYALAQAGKFFLHELGVGHLTEYIEPAALSQR